MSNMVVNTNVLALNSHRSMKNVGAQQAQASARLSSGLRINSASESRIRDTDMAKEMMNLTKTNVLSQAATSMLSQANQSSQNILSLIR
jgi:flagellin